MSTAHSRRAWLMLAVALALTVLAYWPSLHGGYEFDDYPNIVENGDVHLTSLDAASLRKAALASPSSVLVRPLAMLSFALDWYFAGGNPLPMRVVNLIIHLLNGLLLFGLLRTLCRSLPPRHDNAHLRDGWLPAVVAAAWLLAPINFTAVAYIVQRMESLCQLFVLAGLWGYIGARRRMLAGKPGFARATASIVLGTALGGLAKESAALLPLYALIVEWIVFGFARADGRVGRRLLGMYLVVLALPACAALYWVAGHARRPAPGPGGHSRSASACSPNRGSCGITCAGRCCRWQISLRSTTTTSASRGDCSIRRRRCSPSRACARSPSRPSPCAARFRWPHSASSGFSLRTCSLPP